MSQDRTHVVFHSAWFSIKIFGSLLAQRRPYSYRSIADSATSHNMPSVRWFRSRRGLVATYCCEEHNDMPETIAIAGSAPLSMDSGLSTAFIFTEVVTSWPLTVVHGLTLVEPRFATSRVSTFESTADVQGSRQIVYAMKNIIPPASNSIKQQPGTVLFQLFFAALVKYRRI